MKFLLSDLKQYLATEANVDEIANKLTFIGLEVEAIEDKAKNLAVFSVAQILSAQKVENSDKLNLCQIDVGEGKILQIICGAKNARAGIKVAYAPIGSIIPANQMVIKKAKIAGVESSGMLCSFAELGLGKDGEGIIEINDKWSIGEKITKVFGIDDAVLEINVTPNRGDCLGVYGVARDLAATGIGQLKQLEIPSAKTDFAFPLNIQNQEKSACGFIAFRLLKNVKNCQSPKWLQEKLEAVGLNSISTVVDVTNYVMYLLNRPMHAYDFAKIEGDVEVRFAKVGEKILTLQDQEISLAKNNLLIADAKKPLAIAGIIGGKELSCELTTTDILLEAAHFSAQTIYESGENLAIKTDSKYRFERGVDYNNCLAGIELATKLIFEICGEVEVSEIVISKNEFKAKEIEFDLNKIQKLIGVKVERSKVLEILQKLDFAIKEISAEKILVTIPSHRSDVFTAEDLVEEVIRIFGYDKIIMQKITDDLVVNNFDIGNKIRSILVSTGFVETINWSFIDENLVELFAAKNPNLLLANPISVEMNYMRPNLVIGLLNSFKRNELRGFGDLSLFEIGSIFANIDAQKLCVSGLRTGQNKEEDSFADVRRFDIFDVKNDLFEVVEACGVNAKSLQIDDSSLPKYYHPHRAATLKLGKNIVGYFGEINPYVLKKFDLKARINVFEVFLDNLPIKEKSAKKSFVFNDLQPVWRDFAFIVNENQKVGEIIRVIEKTDNLIEEVNIFDIFAGQNVEKGKKSVALRVKIQPVEKTLTSKEIDDLSAKIIDNATKSFAALLRA